MSKTTPSLPPPDDDSLDETLENSGLPESLRKTIKEVVEAADEIKDEIQKEREILYEGETFEGQLGLLDDLGAYDQAAYTRSKVDYSGYRYNLSDDAYSQWGAGGGTWMSSWYSGYQSVDSALEGVHSHVATFITNADYEALEIVPDLEDTDGSSLSADLHEKGKGPGSVYTDYSKSLIVRIDSSLYEKLGISEAQQHYIVDGIAQILGAQAIPDPSIITMLQSTGDEFNNIGNHSLGYRSPIVIPNVVREITTEIMRSRGIDLLVEQMPGWQKRVTAFRAVMFIGEPPNNDVPSAFLMYAIWERDVVESIEHQDAIDAIVKIEEIIDGPVFGSSTARGHVRTRLSRVYEIEQVLIEYLTSLGSVGTIYGMVNCLKERILEAIRASYVFEGERLETLTVDCEEILTPINDHNRTFFSDGKKAEVRHQDFPDCPNKALLPDTKRARVETTRKCVFHLSRIPVDVSTINVDEPMAGHRRAIRRIDDILGLMDAKDMKSFLQAMDKAIGEKSGGKAGLSVGLDKSGKPGEGRSGVSCTKHPELRSKLPINNGGTDRNFAGDDPDFSRQSIVIYEADQK